MGKKPNRRKPDTSEATAAMFEPYIIEPLIGIPIEALKEFVKGVEEGVPTAIARHPVHGYAAIQSSGQGPYFVWREEQSS